MTDLELHELRRKQWRIDGHAIRTIEDARAFIEGAGFCLMYPERPAVLAPSFIAAFVGSEQGLPTQRNAYSDPRAAEATGLVVRLLRERAAYEVSFAENNSLLLSAAVFPYFYALAGDRNPRQAPVPGSRSPYSALACDVYAMIERGGPISKRKMQEDVGGSVSEAALDKALHELWSKLRITRVDYSPADGSSWDLLHRWAPEPLKEAVNMSVIAALSALLTKYLDDVVAAEPAELELFFGNYVPRSRVKDATNALLAAREMEFVRVGSRSMVQMKALEVPAPPVLIDEKTGAPKVFAPRPPRTPRPTAPPYFPGPARLVESGISASGEAREDQSRKPFVPRRPRVARPDGERSYGDRSGGKTFDRSSRGGGPPRERRGGSGRPGAGRYDRARTGQGRPEQTSSDQTRSNQTRSNQTRSNQTRSNQTRSGETRPDGKRSGDGENRFEERRPGGQRFGGPRFGNQRSDRSRSDKSRSDKSRSDRPRPDGPRSERPRSERPRFDKPRSDRERSGRPDSQGGRPPRKGPRPPRRDFGKRPPRRPRS